MRALALALAAAMVVMPAVAAPQDGRIGGPVGHVLDKAGVQPIAAGQSQGSPEASPGVVTVGGQKFDLGDAIIQKVLPDLTYARALAHQNNNTITAPCFDAIYDLVNGWNAPVFPYVPPATASTSSTTTPAAPAASPTALTMPDPHVLVALERASELLHQLQPDSKISIGCGALGQALQKDISTLVGTVLSGGALGLFKLPVVPLP